MNKASLILIPAAFALFFGSGCLSRDVAVPTTTAPVATPPQPTPTSTTVDDRQTKADLIQVFNLSTGQKIMSPIALTGKARGTWFFEASFPIALEDSRGREIAIAIAQADGEWMTTDFVNWHATLTFSNPASATGTLVFKKDNPSGDPERDDALRIPIAF